MVVLFSCMALPAITQPGTKAAVHVKDNSIYISLPKIFNISQLNSFISNFNLDGIGLHSFLLKRNADSLSLLGWALKPDSALQYTIYKSLAAGADFNKNGKLFPLTINMKPEDWNIVGGNLTVFGYNNFKPGREFSQTAEGTEFLLPEFKNVKSVKLAGNFTNWQAKALAMKKTPEGWVATVKLKPGRYTYKFIINNNYWITDPNNNINENDGEGNINSVYFVTNQSFNLKGNPYADKVYLSGSFNNWAADQIPLQKGLNGWQLNMYLQPGTHTYHYIVDGKIVTTNGKTLNSVALGKGFQFKLNGFTNARKVVLAGNFNNWKENSILMQRTETGWTTNYVLGPGNYQYKFIVDGNWILDPLNKNIVDDGDGNQNSFMVNEPNYTFKLNGFAKAKRVSLSGDFNNWSPQGYEMIKENGVWVGRVFLSKGKHLYKFIVDRKWMRDPANALWEDGDDNSVIWIE